MNNLDLFYFHYTKVFTIAKRLLIPIFKEHKSNDRPIRYFYNDLTDKIKMECDNKFVFKNQKLFPEAYKAFHFRHNSYEGSEKDLIDKILNNEIYNYFKTCYVPFNHKTFMAFVIDLAVEEALNYIHHHLDNYYDYYHLIYKTNKYEYFSLKNFENKHYTESEEYRLMQDIDNPARIKERKAEQARQTKESKEAKDAEEMVEAKDTKEVSLDKTNNKYLKILNNFSDDERSLIAHVIIHQIVKSHSIKFNQVSFLKLIKIIGHTQDVSLFEKTPQNSTFYSKVNKGLDYYSSLGTKCDLLDSTILKLEALNLNVVGDKLKLMKNKLKL